MFTHTHLHKPCENKSFSLNLCWMLFSRLLLFLHLFSLNFLCKQLDFIKITLRTLVLMQYFECVSFFAGWMASFCCFFWWNESEIILWMVFSVCYSFFSLTKRHLLFFSISSNDVTLMHNVSGSVCCFVVCLVFNIILFVWFSFFFFFFLICFFFISLSSHIIYSLQDYGDLRNIFLFCTLLLFLCILYRLIYTYRIIWAWCGKRDAIFCSTKNVHKKASM